MKEWIFSPFLWAVCKWPAFPQGIPSLWGCTTGLFHHLLPLRHCLSLRPSPNQGSVIPHSSLVGLGGLLRPRWVHRLSPLMGQIWVWFSLTLFIISLALFCLDALLFCTIKKFYYKTVETWKGGLGPLFKKDEHSPHSQKQNPDNVQWKVKGQHDIRPAIHKFTMVHLALKITIFLI